MVRDLLESNPDRDSSSKEPEKSDNASTSKQPEIGSSELSSDSSEEEILIPQTPSSEPMPPHHLNPSPAHVPTLETASAVTKPAHPQEQYGALSIHSSDRNWYDNLHELLRTIKDWVQDFCEKKYNFAKKYLYFCTSYEFES